MKRIILLFAMIIHVMSIFAYAFSSFYKGNNLYYDNVANGKCKVTYYSSNASDNNTHYQGNIEIPGSITYNGVTYEVVEIGSDAFYGCKNLTSIVIPNSVIKISSGAFEDCSGLTSVSLGEGVTTIEDSGFAWCPLISSPIYNSHIFAYLPKSYSSYTVPVGITKIAPSAFSENISLRNVTLPSTLTEIGNYAFINCSSLIDVQIPDQVKIIGREAFYGCTSLDAINIPSSVEEIGDWAFNNTKWSKNSSNGLLYINDCLIQTKGTISGEISVKEGTRLIANYTFSDAQGITKINLPHSVRFIGKYAFKGCSGLTSFNLPSTIESIERNTFEGCKALKELDIPSSVKNIGYMAFYSCTGLTKVSIAGTVNSYGSSIFGNCPNIIDLVYEEGVESTFNTGLSNLSKITLPKSLKSIGRYSFSNWSKLKEIQIPENVTSIGSYAFSGCTGLEEVAIPNNVDSIYNNAFENCKNIHNLDLGNSVTFIGNEAFRNCLSLTELTIPKTLESGSSAFYGCSNIQTLTYEEGTNTVFRVDARSVLNVSIPESVTIIGKEAFVDYSNLESVTLPSNLKEIATSAFSGCSKISEIEIPSTVDKIGKYAFDDCSGLSKVEISDIDAWVEVQFDGISANPLRYAKCLYLNDNLVTDIKLSSNVKSIGDYAFYNMTNLKSLEIPSSVNSLGKYFVSGCSNLNNLKVWWEAPMNIDNFTFSGITPSTITLTVSRGTKPSYTTASYWNSFKIEETECNFKRVDKEGNTFESVLSLHDGDAENNGVSLVDGDQKVVVFNDIDLLELHYTRDFTNTNWQSLYVPFAMQYDDWADDFEVARLNDVHQFDDNEDGEIDRTVLELVKLKDGSSTEPNTPYMIKVKEVGEKTITLTDATLYATEENSFDVTSWYTKFTFTGTYNTITDMATKGNYALANGGLMQATSDAATLGAFRWYLDITDRNGNPASLSAKKIFLSFDDGEITEIKMVEVNTNSSTDAIYTISGVKVGNNNSSLPKGLYISNGKKCLFK